MLHNSITSRLRCVYTRHDPSKWYCTTDDSSVHSIPILCNVLLKFWHAMLSRAIWLHSAKVNDRERTASEGREQ